MIMIIKNTLSEHILRLVLIIRKENKGKKRGKERKMLEQVKIKIGLYHIPPKHVMEIERKRKKRRKRENEGGK